MYIGENANFEMGFPIIFSQTVQDALALHFGDVMPS